VFRNPPAAVNGGIVGCDQEYYDRIATGSITTNLLLNYLAESGHHDVAYRLVMGPKFPSYGFMVDSGATAMWERFDTYVPGLGFNPKGMNGFNHVGLNSVGEWMFAYVGGLKPDAPGWKHFTVAPKLGTELTWVDATYDSLHGPIQSRYELADGMVRCRLSCRRHAATVVVPSDNADAVTEGGKPRALWVK